MFPKCFIILFYVNCQLSLVSGHCGDCWKCFCPIWRVVWSGPALELELSSIINQARHTTQSSLQLSSLSILYPLPPLLSVYFDLISVSKLGNVQKFVSGDLEKYHKAILYGVLGKELIFSRRVLILMSQVSSSKTSFSRSREPHQPEQRPQRQNLEIPC